MLVWLSGYIAIYNSQEVLGSTLDMYSFFSLLYNQCKIINLLNGVHQTGVQSTPPVYSSDKSPWTPHGLSSPVDSSGLQSTPVMTDISRLGCGESPLQSTGVYMEYGGDRQELHQGYNTDPQEDQGQIMEPWDALHGQGANHGAANQGTMG